MNTSLLQLSVIPIFSLTLVGCYPIEKVYVRTEKLNDGEQNVESISKIKIDKASRTGALVRSFDGPDYEWNHEMKKWVSTGARSKTKAIGKLDNCMVIDDSNWRCKYEELWSLQMIEGQLRWSTGQSESFYETTYKLAF